MNTCKECRYWKPGGPYRDGMDGGGEVWIRDLGECFCDKLRWSKPYCRRPDEPNTTPPDAASIFETTDINTGPDFGCVHWKAKEPPP